MPCPFLSDFIVEHEILWYGTAFWSSWSAVLALSLPRVLSTPSLRAFEGGIETKIWYSGNTAQQQPKHFCVICSVPATNTEHSMNRAAVGKGNSSPDRPSTAPERGQVEQGLQVLCWSGEISLFLSFNPATIPAKAFRSTGSLLWH